MIELPGGKQNVGKKASMLVGGNSPNATPINKVSPLGGNGPNSRTPSRNTRTGANYVPGQPGSGKTVRQ